MRALYEIDADIMNCVDEETGEILDFETLNALQMERDAKIEGVALCIKQLNAEAALIREEEKALAERRKKKEIKAERLKVWLEEVLKGQAFETPKVSLGWRKSERLIIARDVLDLAEYLKKEGYSSCVKYGEMTLDKAVITSYIKKGVEIPGVYLSKRQNLQLK